MNVIFLDIDGVLNHELFYEKRQEKVLNDNENFIKLPKELRDIDVEKVKLLNKLCADTKSKVVISSTWRIGRTVDELREMFKNVGFTFEIIDKTPASDHRVRGVEIKSWLKSNLSVTNYVILDDDSDFLIAQQKHFFWVDRYCGLTPTICYKIEIFLNNSIMSTV